MPTTPFDDPIKKAAALLKKEELVAFPTETVYGLGGLASSPKAIEKIFAVKGRSYQKPLSLLIPDKTHVKSWAKKIPLNAEKLIEAFWPGPITLLFEPHETVLAGITAQSGRIGLRVPSHPVALSLLSTLNHALAAPSANISGQLSPTTANVVREQLKNHVSYILEDDSCNIGIESTVIDITQKEAIIHRLGAISRAAIEKVIGEKVLVNTKNHTLGDDFKLKMEWAQAPFDDIIFRLDHSTTAILAYNTPQRLLLPSITYIAMPSVPSLYQRFLYQQLSQLQKVGYRHILIERLPRNAAWEPINTCLNRWCKNTILN